MNIKKQIFLLTALILVTVIITSAALFLFNKESDTLKIQVSETGTLYIETLIDIKSDRTYKICWETDGGSVAGDTDSTLNYYCFSDIDSHIYWSPKDQDGNIYTCATIKVHIYEEISYNMLDFSEYEPLASANLTIDLNTETGHPIASQTQRVFGNPMREGSVDWQEIYQLYEHKDENNNYKVLRYRTGNNVSPGDTICWETNAAPLIKAKFTAVPIYSPSTDSSNKQYVKNTYTVCFNTGRFENLFFTNDRLNSDGTAQIKISAFIADTSGNKFNADYSFEINTK